MSPWSSAAPRTAPGKGCEIGHGLRWDGQRTMWGICDHLVY
jgi:hypothetical protein